MRKNKIRSKIRTPAKKINFKDIDYDNLVKMINMELPINFKKYKILDKIYQKYPLTNKEEIALIIKAVFEIIREKVIEGYKINIRYIFNDFHLVINKSVSGHPFVLAKNTTFPKVRKNV